MEKGDLLTLIGGVILVLVIAVVTNPHYIPSLTPAPAVTPTPVMTPVVPVTLITPAITATPLPLTPTSVPTVAPAYRISYNNSPFSYPRFKLPDNLAIYGAGDLPLRGREMVPFAYISETKGGLTNKFSVPYPIWVLNTTVVANRTPQYGNFKMVLCFGNNGTIIDGEEILNRGSMTRVVQTSGGDMYMIISTAYIDSYRIDLETPRDYYNTYRPR